MNKIRKGDEVIILTGKDKGKTGNVVRAIPEDDRVIVDNVNMVKKHQKPNPALNVPGGIIEKEMPIHVSNVALVNPATGKADRVGFKT
jgi:large subunit ribosomal protein L24